MLVRSLGNLSDTVTIDFKISKVVIQNFRGIDALEIELKFGYPSVLIGSNNAGKTAVLNAIALALNGGDYYRYEVDENDFYCSDAGVRSRNFLVQVHFHSNDTLGYPAVKGVGAVSMVHGVQVKGTMTKDGRMSHSRTLFDETGKPITILPRTPVAAADKAKFAEHDVGFKTVNAKLSDVATHTPEIWFFRPQNIEASLYVWKTGPIARLSKLLAERYLQDEWDYKLPDGSTRPMPKAVTAAYKFFQQSTSELPFWKEDMKPRLERVIGKYVGTHAKIDLRPDTQLIEDWLAQKLAVSLATDPDSVATPLRKMGDGWQSVIRLAALEALCEYADVVKERIILLLEEPETHLHPHLRRKVRKVLSALAAKGWTVVYTTHSAELVSFQERQVITRLVRVRGKVISRSVNTDDIDDPAKLQSKLDDNGSHDFLFGTCAVFCEGQNDTFAIRQGFDKLDLDYDARSVSIMQCGGVSGIPAFARIARTLGIRWCALTDEDMLPTGEIKPATQQARDALDRLKDDPDMQIQWTIDLEHCLSVIEGKAAPEVVAEILASPQWQANHPEFKSTLAAIAAWIDPATVA